MAPPRCHRPVRANTQADRPRRTRFRRRRKAAVEPTIRFRLSLIERPVQRRVGTIDLNAVNGDRDDRPCAEVGAAPLALAAPECPADGEFRKLHGGYDSYRGRTRSRSAVGDQITLPAAKGRRKCQSARADCSRSLPEVNQEIVTVQTLFEGSSVRLGPCAEATEHRGICLSGEGQGPCQFPASGSTHTCSTAALRYLHRE